jgi:Tfp pilus assembly protein FimV
VLVVIFALLCFFLLYAVTFTPKTAAAAPAATKAAPAKKAAAAKAPTPAKAAKAATPTKAAASTDGPASGRRSARKRTGVERFEPY